MIIYNYSPITGEYLSENQARKDPLEEDRFLIPANATDIAPPQTGPNEVAVFSDSKWEVKADYRGLDYWLGYGDKRTIDEIGETAPSEAFLTEPEPPPPTPEQIEAAKISIVQNHMDEAARALRYDDIKTAVTYAEETAVPKFQAEGQAFREWRSLVWAACYAILDDVNAGNRGIPTDAELIAELPVLVLPE